MAFGSALVARAEAPARHEVVPPFLLGGAVVQKPREIALDPLLPRGELRPLGDSEAADRDATLCARSRPLCVRAPDVTTRRDALALLEVAYDRQHFGAHLPVHEAGSPPLLWAPSDDELTVSLDERARLSFDRARPTCRGGRRSPRDATRCIAEASIATLAPATPASLRSGFAVAAHAELRGADAFDRAEYERAQKNPERALLTRASTSEGAGSALFFHFLDDAAEDAGPLAPSFLAITLAATRTPARALRYEAEPDAFDVLRASLAYERARLAALFDDFAAARLGLGVPGAFLDLDDRALAPRFAWDVTSQSLPRTLLLTRPFEPSGSVYLRVSLDRSNRTANHAFRIECEQPVSYVWSIARLDSNGREIGRVRVAFQERGSSFDQRVEPLEGTDSLVLVGTNLGGIDLDHPFDPDHAPLEAHSCSVYVARLP